MSLAAFLAGTQSYDAYLAEALAEVGTRVLAAEKRVGPWREYRDVLEGDHDDVIEHEYGEYWTVIDRDTGEQVGSFGMPVQLATRDLALAEAERFGSKWDWPTDREWTQP